MPILSPLSNNLTFQHPDIYKGAAALGQGIQAIGAGLDKRQFNQERKTFLDGLQLPGDQYEAQLPGSQMEADRAANGGYEGLGDAWQRKQDIAAARARSFGVDTGGYDNIRNREAAEAAATAKQKAEEMQAQQQREQSVIDSLNPNERNLLNIAAGADTDAQTALSAVQSLAQIQGIPPESIAQTFLNPDQIAIFEKAIGSIGDNEMKSAAVNALKGLAKGTNVFDNLRTLATYSLLSNMNLQDANAAAQKPEVTQKVNSAIMNAINKNAVKAQAGSLFSNEQKSLWSSASQRFTAASPPANSQANAAPFDIGSIEDAALEAEYRKRKGFNEEF
jgi:hypothetical protein